MTLTGGEAGYYSVVYTTAANDFTTVPAPLTITASSASMVYGSNPPAVTPAASGFESSDNGVTHHPTDVFDDSQQREHSVQLAVHHVLQ